MELKYKISHSLNEVTKEVKSSATHKDNLNQTNNLLFRKEEKNA
jgi:hypothetical protein